MLSVLKCSGFSLEFTKGCWSNSYTFGRSQGLRRKQREINCLASSENSFGISGTESALQT